MDLGKLLDTGVADGLAVNDGSGNADGVLTLSNLDVQKYAPVSATPRIKTANHKIYCFVIMVMIIAKTLPKIKSRPFEKGRD